MISNLVALLSLTPGERAAMSMIQGLGESATNLSATIPPALVAMLSSVSIPAILKREEPLPRWAFDLSKAVAGLEDPEIVDRVVDIMLQKYLGGTVTSRDLLSLANKVMPTMGLTVKASSVGDLVGRVHTELGSQTDTLAAIAICPFCEEYFALNHPNQE